MLEYFCKDCGVSLVCTVNIYSCNFRRQAYYCNDCWKKKVKRYYNKSKHTKYIRVWRKRNCDLK